MNDDTTLTAREHRKLAPMLILAGILLFAVPVLHPNNTCHDWLEKWGQLSAKPMWVPSHQLAMGGFALAAIGGLLLGLLKPRTPASLFGGGAMLIGYATHAILVLFHATAVSVIGAAYNATKVQAERDALKVQASAWVALDVAACGVAVIFVSVGAALIAWHLHRVGLISRIAAIFFALVGWIWVAQYYPRLRIVPIPFGEWLPYSSIALWMLGIGLLLQFGGRRRAVAAQPEPAPATA